MKGDGWGAEGSRRAADWSLRAVRKPVERPCDALQPQALGRPGQRAPYSQSAFVALGVSEAREPCDG
jgi:hypothetical protein